MKRSSIIIKRAFSLLFVLLLGLGGFFAVTLRLPQAHALANAPSQRYLSPTGIDTDNDCTNLAAPCASLQHALDMGQANDLILAAGGVYTDLYVSNSMTQVAVISQPVTIQGGYTAVYTEPPDPFANPTIFDAGGQGRVLTLLDAGQVTLNGLQLMGGATNGSADRGGGLYAINSTLTLVDSAIRQNRAGYGGGLYLQNSQIDLQRNDISDNEAQFSGGGLRCYACTGTLSQNQILSNTAVLHGGGFQLTNSPITLADNIIQYNQVSVVTSGWGGGGHLHNSAASLIRNTISGNSAYQGGGLRLISSVATLQGNVIQGNQATIGGGLSLETTSNAILENNAVLGNNASSQGDGIYILNAQPNLSFNTFNGNGETAVFVGGLAKVNLMNSVIANQTNGIINTGAAVTLTTTLWDNVTTPTQGSVQESNAISGTAGFAADGYHITAVSDALNNATANETTIDIDNQQRPHYGGFDIGADEWWPLDATKSVSHDSVKPGLTVTYTIILTNDADTAMNFLLTDTLPIQVDFSGPISATSGSPGFSSGSILWQGILSPTQSATILWPVQIAADVQPGTTITNSATIQDERGIYETTTAVMVVPSEIYLPMIMK